VNAWSKVVSDLYQAGKDMHSLVISLAHAWPKGG
jgi:hypothetical protein